MIQVIVIVLKPGSSWVEKESVSEALKSVPNFRLI